MKNSFRLVLGGVAIAAFKFVTKVDWSISKASITLFNFYLFVDKLYDCCIMGT